jgi:hypothetical protein
MFKDSTFRPSLTKRDANFDGSADRGTLSIKYAKPGLGSLDTKSVKLISLSIFIPTNSFANSSEFFIPYLQRNWFHLSILNWKDGITE